jgi:glucose-6-phosphate isomerase
MRESNQALFNTDEVLLVDDDLVAELKRRALDAPTRRFRLCLHQSPEDAVQEMIVVHCRDNYSRPHSHSVATSMMILEGELTVLLFADDGEVTRRIEMGARASGKPFALRLEPGGWHMPVCRSEQLVFYETQAGPFVRERVNVWAPWSPAEDDPAAVAGYMRSLGFA